MPHSSFRPTLESLESREVPSANLLSQGTLSIVGTEQADDIRVSYSTDATEVEVKHTANGATTVESFDRAAVANLVIRGTGGNDYIRNDTSLRSAIFGGKGDDTIWGGSSADLLFGNEGNDRLYGGLGDDKLWGMDGIDTLIGRLGDDYLNGGAGNDRLGGGKGADTLEGGAGRDVLFGASAEDTIIDPASEDIRGVERKREMAALNAVQELTLIAGELVPFPGRAARIFGRANIVLIRTV
jgi:Ca2+-binding RTX toxin-like protein